MSHLASRAESNAAHPTSKRGVARTLRLASLTTGLFMAAMPLWALPANAKGLSASQLIPHQASYEMTLDSVSPSSEVIGVDGRSSYALANECSGLATSENYLLRFMYNSGDEITIASRYQAWEQSDGQLFNFDLHEESSYEPSLKLDGYAMLGADASEKGAAYFSVEPTQAMPIPADTLFPVAHLLALLDKAEKGERQFSAKIFFGAEPDRALKTAVAFISDKKTRQGEGFDHALILPEYWPVRIAYFDPSADAPEPDYEVMLELQENGLVAGYAIDYGDLVIKANLRALDKGANPDCT